MSNINLNLFNQTCGGFYTDNKVMFPKLFTPMNINGVEIKNRVVFYLMP